MRSSCSRVEVMASWPLKPSELFMTKNYVNRNLIQNGWNVKLKKLLSDVSFKINLLVYALIFTSTSKRKP